MLRFINVLKDPYIVANIQNFFGVSYDETISLRPISGSESPEHSRMLRKKNSRNSIEVEDSKNEEENYNLNKISTEDSKVENGNKTQDTREYKNYLVKNKFWYIFFFLGTYLGDVVGYAIFLPFWFWNVDGKIGGKIVMVWTLIMYIGQIIKDIVCWPRPPCPPVIRLQKKWSLEYGMPSTHAMVGIALPSSVMYYTVRRYKFPVEIGIIGGLLWCTLISLSRLYLGMHSLLDVLAGLLLSSLLVIPFLPTIDYVGDIVLPYYWYPLVIITISIVLIVIYPTGNTWTPTRGDTATILGTCVGIQIGFWVNYQFNLTHPPPYPPPFYFESIEWKDFGIGMLRTLSGYVGIVLSFIIFEFIKKTLDCILIRIRIPVRDTHTKRRQPVIDLFYKYLTYSVTAFHVSYSFPYLFHYFKIGRSNYYWE